MRTLEILKEIERLPLQTRIYIVEQTLHSIRTKEGQNELKNAAQLLMDDYKNDKELTIFTNL